MYPIRKIIHVDMDAFYASIEQRDNSEYRGKPVAVGYSEARGVVAAASYEARQYGVRSAMASVTAKRKCPNLIFVPPHFEVYREVSRQIMGIFLEYTDLVEPLSLDEAFLDVTVNHRNMPSATIIAQEIKERIWKETGLYASAGVSYNKFLAKIASDYKKPNGFFVILPEEAEKFIEQLPIESFFGVGKVTAKKMHNHNIFNGLQLKQQTKTMLIKWFGKLGLVFYDYARGIDLREVTPHRIIKSISAERTFEKDFNALTPLTIELYHIAQEVMQRVVAEEFQGRTVTLKVKFSDFKIISRSKTTTGYITDFQKFWPIAKELLKNVDLSQKGVRLLGIGISNSHLTTFQKYTQLELDLF